MATAMLLSSQEDIRGVGRVPCQPNGWQPAKRLAPIGRHLSAAPIGTYRLGALRFFTLAFQSLPPVRAPRDRGEGRDLWPS